MITITLNGKSILAISKQKNIHKFSLRAMVSAQTAYKYVKDSERVKSVDLEVLAHLLGDGCSLTAEQILNMKIGDLFNIVEK